MNAVAQGIVTYLGLDMALVSRYVEDEAAFVGLALHPIPRQFTRLLQLLGRQDLQDDPTGYKLPYHRGQNNFIDRTLDGELVTGQSLADFFAPWVPRPAATTVQKLAGMQSLADVPMQVKDKTVGTILVATRQPSISAEQRQALVRVASQAAVAIENSRLFQAERQRAAELVRSNAFLTALSHVAARIERTPSPDQILETLGTELSRLGITCFIALRRPDTGKLLGHYTSVESGALDTAQKLVGLTIHDFQIPSDSQPFIQVMDKGQPLFVADLVAMTSTLLPKVPARVSQQALSLAGVPPDTPAAYLPLWIEEKALGLMTVWGQGLRKEDVPALSVFAHQVAIALENARLVQDLEWSLHELRETQSQLVQAQKMEAVGRLAGGVAHDFNNLLTIVELSTRLMVQQLHPRDPLREHVRQIQEASERGTRLTQQLLRFSRREAVEPQVIDLGRLVTNMDRMLQRIAGEDVELTTDLAPNLWPVQADLSQMEQVIVNLTVNARDAMPAGGKLSIQTANVTLTEVADVHHLDVEPGEYVLLRVADSGEGMNAEMIEHIFEPFFTTKERGRGTGLGLPTVYGIIRQNQGYIEVESEPDQGTTFRIYLPRTTDRDRHQIKERKSTLTPVAGGTETILVVEDEFAVRRLAVQILEEQGYQVLKAANGPEALDVSRQHDGPIDLLLTDVIMPGMNGRELAEQLRAHRPNLRVLYMSGYSDDVIALQTLSAPGMTMLSKPFSLEVMSAKVRATLDMP
jgi:signal transduction histidine kinase/CheY-like chemotaxis protein